MSKVRVVLIDDHLGTHQAVTTGLKNASDIQLVGQGSNGHEAIQLCDDLRPDVLLLDILMPMMDGIEATKIIHKKYPSLKILVLSNFQDDESVRSMLENGATGYILKGSLATDLIVAIRAAHQGSTVLSAEVTRTLLRPADSEPKNDFGLTEREKEVLRLLADGKNNGEIAGVLSISQSTVKFHINNIQTKMNVGTRAEVIVSAAKNRLI